mgnify:CR=1 FL=1
MSSGRVVSTALPEVKLYPSELCTVAETYEGFEKAVDDAWNAQDLTPVRGLVTSSLRQYLQFWIDEYKRQGLANKLVGLLMAFLDGLACFRSWRAFLAYLAYTGIFWILNGAAMWMILSLMDTGAGLLGAWAVMRFVMETYFEVVWTNALAIVLGAHLDTVAVAPGAEDNASGVAVLLELARLARAAPTRWPVTFVAFGAEEPRGPADDQHHFGSLRRAARVGDEPLRAMVSLDRVGAAGPVRVCTGGLSPPKAVRELLAAAERLDVRAGRCENRTSDHWPFFAMPTGTTSYLSRSIASSTPAAVTQLTACSLERPPNSTRTRGLAGGVTFSLRISVRGPAVAGRGRVPTGSPEVRQQHYP